MSTKRPQPHMASGGWILVLCAGLVTSVAAVAPQWAPFEIADASKKPLHVRVARVSWKRCFGAAAGNERAVFTAVVGL